MTAQTQTISTLAGEAYAQMERRERNNGEAYYTTTDNAAEWVKDMIHDAHGDMLPDDWRYDCIHSALAHISDTDAEDTDDLDDAGHEFADGNVNPYNAARIAWLASNLYRAGYCDDAATDMGCDGSVGIFDRIGMGMYAESLEVFESVRQSLSDRMDDLS